MRRGLIGRAVKWIPFDIHCRVLTLVEWGDLGHDHVDLVPADDICTRSITLVISSS